MTMIDPRSGRYLNANLSEYHVPVSADIRGLDVIFIPEEDSHVDPIGVKGIGEIGTTGVAAAVANAVSTPPESGCAICRSRWTNCCASNQSTRRRRSIPPVPLGHCFQSPADGRSAPRRSLRMRRLVVIPRQTAQTR